MMRDFKVVTILVNWQQAEHTLKAAEAIFNQSIDSKIVVVDNGSQDNSIDVFTERLSPDVLVIHNKMNKGFGSGVNLGLDYAMTIGAEYAWLVNNDSVPTSKCLEYMLIHAQENAKYGVIGGIIIDPLGSVTEHSGTIMDELFLGCHNSIIEEELNRAKFSWITGACMLLDMKAIRDVGKFDPVFFMYWEDADLCMRIKNAGYNLGIAEDAISYHTAGTSSNNITLSRYTWHINSGIVWLAKNYPFYAWGVMIIFLRHFAASIAKINLKRLILTCKLACNLMITKVNFNNRGSK